MIIHWSGLPRTLVALAMAVVLIALSVGVPLLDLGWNADRVAIGTEGTAPGFVDHDHAICLQYGATAWSAATATGISGESLVDLDPIRPVVALLSEFLLHSAHRPRAPPTA